MKTLSIKTLVVIFFVMIMGVQSSFAHLRDRDKKGQMVEMIEANAAAEANEQIITVASNAEMMIEMIEANAVAEAEEMIVVVPKANALVDMIEENAAAEAEQQLVVPFWLELNNMIEENAAAEAAEMML